MLIHLLHDEAKTLNMQACLVSEDKLSHVEHNRYCRAQAAIFKVWDNYTTWNKAANQLLKVCSKHVHTPNDT